MAARVVRLADRAVLQVGGVDARPFLQGLLTNDVIAVAPGHPVYAGLLSPQGKTLFALILFDDGTGGLLIDCDRTQRDLLLKRLTLYRLRAAVTLTPRDDLSVWAAWGEPPAADAAPDPRNSALGWRWLSAAPETETATLSQWRAHRIASGVPEGADELGFDEILWLETNARDLHGVDFTKGCYVGQENTARMHHRDKVRRGFVAVRIADAVDAANPVMAEGREAGRIRAREGAVALAFLRLEPLEHGQSLTCGGAPVSLL